ncbi:hypothetical protein [Microbacterium sp. A84]|uniref:hypothetical protein n=1 Tax=Microbacterium sp. A84 TaxID=3450715 RepID=UPI003F43C07C
MTVLSEDEIEPRLVESEKSVELGVHAPNPDQLARATDSVRKDPYKLAFEEPDAKYAPRPSSNS